MPLLTFGMDPSFLENLVFLSMLSSPSPTCLVNLNTPPLTLDLTNPYLNYGLQPPLNTDLLSMQLLQLSVLQSNAVAPSLGTTIGLLDCAMTPTATSSTLNHPVSEISVLEGSKLKKASLRSSIREVVEFIIDSTGRISQTEIETHKRKYYFDSNLIKVFDILYSKYASTIKTKEEMVKYIIRRAFKYIKNNIRKAKNIDSKSACKEICEKYFNKTREDLEKEGVNLDDEDEFFNALLPFRYQLL